MEWVVQAGRENKDIPTLDLQEIIEVIETLAHAISVFMFKILKSLHCGTYKFNLMCSTVHLNPEGNASAVARNKSHIFMIIFNI